MLQALPTDEECLRHQLENTQLHLREFNGYGFFTHITVPGEAPACSFVTGQLLANALVGNQLCGFILWITGGKIDFFEGYPLGGDSWPESESFEQIKLNRFQLNA